MEQIGVEAIVEGMMQFGSDMESIQKNIDDVAGSSTILGGAFEWVSGILSDFGASILRTAEIALGNLIADGIETLIGFMKDLGAAIFEAGNQFQTLEIRLKNINFAALVESGMSYDAAMTEAVRLTKEQIDWVVQLANKTPFDATDIANIYAMARSYSFADEEAQKITEAVSNFTSAMGLSNVEAERIVKNFGQMQQQGRITQRDLNDLARGAFVPVNDLLESIRKRFEETGTAGIDFSEDIKKLNDKLATYTDQLAVSELRQKEYDDSMTKAAETNAESLDKMREKLQGYQNDLAVAQKRQSEYGSQMTSSSEDVAQALDKMREKLQKYQNDLVIAEQKQTEFTDKTAESTKMANQFRIDELKQSIANTTAEIERLTSSAKTMSGSVKESTLLANQYRIDELKKNIEDTQAAIEKLSSGAISMGSTVKDSTRLANEQKIEDLKNNISDVTAQIATFQTMMQGGGEITKEAFSKMVKNGIPAKEFIDSFVQMVNEKFPNAAQEMARTFKGATENIQQTANSLFGLGLVTPVLDMLGGKVADLLDALISEENYSQLEKAVGNIRDSILWILGQLLQLIPGAETIADGIVDSLNGLAEWLNKNRDTIVEWAWDLGNWIRDDLVPAIRDQLIPFIRDQLIPAIREFIVWIWDNREGIMKFFTDMAITIRDQIIPVVRDILLPAVKELMKWLYEHKDEILPFLENTGKAFVGFAIVQQIVVWVAGLISALLTLVTTVIGVMAIVSSLGTTISGIIGTIGSVILTVGALIIQFEFLKIAFTYIFTFIAERISQLAVNIIQTFQEIGNAIENKDWAALGMAILNGIVRGIQYATVDLIDALWTAAQAGMQAFRDALGIHSPSSVFYEFGYNIVEGIVGGIQDNTGAMMDALVSAAEEMWNAWLDYWGINSPSKLSSESADNIISSFSDTILRKTNEAVSAMQKAAVSIAAPIVNLPSATQSYSATSPAMVGASSNTNNYYNLNINSNANTEPIVQDFNMLESMAGV